MTPDEIKILTEAKKANQWWFVAMLEAASMMVERRKKYAGDEHPYTNFVDLYYRDENRSMMDVFRFYLDIKKSRLSVTGDQDFVDERVIDTFMDAGNYGFLAAGWILGDLTPEDVIPYSEWLARRIQYREDKSE